MANSGSKGSLHEVKEQSLLCLTLLLMPTACAWATAKATLNCGQSHSLLALLGTGCLTRPLHGGLLHTPWLAFLGALASTCIVPEGRGRVQRRHML